MAAEGGTVPKNVRSSGASETPSRARGGQWMAMLVTSLALAGANPVVLIAPARAAPVPRGAAAPPASPPPAARSATPAQPGAGSGPPSHVLATGAGASAVVTAPAPALVAAQPPGPTRTFNVPMAYTLPAGTRLFTTNLTLGSTGIAPIYAGAPGVSLGIVGNALNVHADAALSNHTEVGAGIAAASTTPWRGALDIEGKRALLREGVNGAPLSLAAMAGAIFDVNANGVPDIGFQLGVPLTKALAFTDRQVVTFSLFPNWNAGMMGAQGSIGPRPINSLGLGFGMDLALSPAAHVLADTNLGLALGGIQTDSAVGFRYAFSPTMLGQVFLGVGASGPGAAANGLGVGAIMGF